MSDHLLPIDSPTEEHPSPKDHQDDDDKVDVYVAEDLGDGGFLHYFFRIYFASGLIGIAIAFAIGNWQQGLSFTFGFLSMALLLTGQQMTLAFTLKPHKTTWWWETTVVFLRYVLLGLIFYAMISLFAVRWTWFIAGISLIVPGLLGAVIFFKNPESK